MFRARSITLAAALCAAAASACASVQTGADISAPVRTQGGLVQGTAEDGLTVFRGIPFAASTAGENRWRPPQPVEPWDGVLDADAFAPSCFQNSAAIPAINVPAIEVSEDCLYLNVWTPAATSAERLPVMVWIYGGGFFAGSTSYALYSGENLAEKGVVVVQVAYRVGSFGFLAHPELSAESPDGVSGNYGLLDQIAGLEWVQDNIAAFGGDPDRVTIFGESAGGLAVNMLAQSPLAAGLFAGVISESGGSMSKAVASGGRGEDMRPLEVAEQAGLAFAEQLDAASIADMRALPAETVYEASQGAQGVSWPIADDHVLPRDPYTRYQNDEFNDTPILVGFNSDEAAAFGAPATPEAYEAHVRDRYGAMADDVFAAYPTGDADVALRSARALFRDELFGWQTWAWANLQALHGEGDAYLYYFDQVPPAAPGAPPTISLGASHASEMAYVFSHLDQQPLAWTDADRAVSDAMTTYWTNFAKTGDPNGEGVPEWPAYHPEAPLAMMFHGGAQYAPLPNGGQLEVLDAYFAMRRAQ